MLNGRRILLGLAAGSATIVLSACLDQLGPLHSGGSLAIALENSRPGSYAWDRGSADSVISGYGLPFSLQAGDTFHLFVTARHSPVSITIYRLGWYGGAGGRLIEQHAGLRAVDQGPCSPPVPGPSVCNWSETDRFIVDTLWTPGLYIASFADSLNHTQAFPFVVRSGHPAEFVVVLPFATYQAYNPWGGASLYGASGATRAEYLDINRRAYKVSFARPYTGFVFQGQVLNVDYLLVRWLEQHAYDVNYITDYDYHIGRGADPHAIAWLFAGHSEYWTWPMWLRANEGRAEGMSLGFLGGNDIYWVSRFESIQVNGLDAPVVVCYRDASIDPEGSTPGLATVYFRSPPNNAPENSLVGVMGGPRKVIRDYPADLVVANGSDPLFTGTGLTTGEHIFRVAGWEGDRIIDNGVTPPGIRILFQSPYVPVGDSVASEVMQSTIYTWLPSGAMVFAAGEPGFAWGLTNYRNHVARPPIERLLQNVLETFVTAHNHR